MDLLDAGTPPRQLLRYAVPAGQREETVQVTTTRIAVALGGLLPDPPPRTITQRLVWTATQGDDTVTVVLSDASTDDPDDGGRLSRAVGLRGTLTVDAHGRADAAWTRPPGADTAILEDTGSRLPVVLPDVPVGPGAVWRVTDRVATAGIPVDTVATYTLVAHDGDRLHLTADLQATGAPSELALDGFTGRVDAVETTGRQALVVSLDRWLPERNTAALETRLTLRGRKGILPVRMTVVLSQGVEATAR